MKSDFFAETGILLAKMVSRFPFGLIYFLSSVFFYLNFYGFGYRKKIVFKNLRNSFPEKSEKEIRSIAKAFYRHFSDLMLESLKMRGMKESDFEQRVKVANPEVINRFFEQGKSVSILTMHYNNWEWGSFLTKYIKHKPLAVYKPLNNDRFDNYMKKTRSRFKTQLIKNNHILRHLIRYESKKIPVFVWLAGDQSPIDAHDYWFRFLNQEAMIYPGPAIISKRFNYPVFFQKLEKTGRGKYLSTFELLCENPAEKSEQEIIKMYIRKMEEIIKEKPEYFLWSHNRWKRIRPSGIQIH